MPAARLTEFLDSKHAKYVTIKHSPAFTAQEIAASAHIPGKQLAKTVVMKIDGELVMVVVPASAHVRVQTLKDALGSRDIAFAEEREFQDEFPDCEPGAMPPFGNLYGMKVFVSQKLREDEEISFSAGSHTELIRLPYADFEALVKPTPVPL